MASSLASDLEALRGLRIFFGHQSVGANILEGVRTLTARTPDALTISGLRETDSPEASAAAATTATSAERVTRGAPRPPALLLHAKVGRNEDPASKCEAFAEVLDSGRAGRVDVAVLKFCYVDIGSSTDAEALAASYVACLDALSHRHPETVFVPVTAPLRQTPAGPGVWVREFLGRTNHTKAANARRYAYNLLLRRQYAGRPLFDLAASQSTGPDGSRETFVWQGEQMESLRGAYTDDGGHLNAAGQAASAGGFVRALAMAARIRRAQ
jgi:hypothetical protein